MVLNGLFVNGCFDGLHAGHIHLILEGRRLSRSELTVVALNDCDYIRRAKKVVPLLAWQDRRKHLEELRAVDRVVDCGSEPLDVFRDLVQSRAAKQWHWVRTYGSTFLPQEQKFVDAWGIHVIHAAELPGVRSSELYERRALETKALAALKR